MRHWKILGRFVNAKSPHRWNFRMTFRNSILLRQSMNLLKNSVWIFQSFQSENSVVCCAEVITIFLKQIEPSWAQYEVILTL